MNITITQNMAYYVVIILVIGKAIKPLIKKHRKTILPLVLILIGSLLSVIIGKLNGAADIGNLILQGAIASIIAQFGFDKVKEMLSKGVDDV